MHVYLNSDRHPFSLDDEHPLKWMYIIATYTVTTYIPTSTHAYIHIFVSFVRGLSKISLRAGDIALEI